jgi:tRNA1Val (adenine37-N6)-methyltransferase
MKVCTDACLFGAYVADSIEKEHLNVTTCLDIGTGTGLLCLLLAQKCIAHIDAVEIELAAFEQAAGNFAQSPWKDRLHIFNEDINSFHTDKKYDCIISNPPFFEGDLKSNTAAKNTAKHDTSLTLPQLLTAVQSYLQPHGFFTALLPHHRVSYFIEEAEKRQLFLYKKIQVKQTAAHDYFRGILFFSRQQEEVTTEDIVIKQDAVNYTALFRQLLHAYYLHL